MQLAREKLAHLQTDFSIDYACHVVQVTQENYDAFFKQTLLHLYCA